MVRLDRRMGPLRRVPSLLRTGALRKKPVWYEAAQLFKPPKPLLERQRGLKKPPKLEFLEDQLAASFHKEYFRRFKEHYVGINHLIKDDESSRNRRSYRDIFLIEQSTLMRRNPGMTKEKAFEITASRLENVRRKERNKLALMSRWAMDQHSEHLDSDFADLHVINDHNFIARAITSLKESVRTERHAMDSMGIHTRKEPKRMVIQRETPEGRIDNPLDDPMEKLHTWDWTSKYLTNEGTDDAALDDTKDYYAQYYDGAASKQTDAEPLDDDESREGNTEVDWNQFEADDEDQPVSTDIRM